MRRAIANAVVRLLEPALRDRDTREERRRKELAAHGRAVAALYGLTPKSWDEVRDQLFFLAPRPEGRPR